MNVDRYDDKFEKKNIIDHRYDTTSNTPVASYKMPAYKIPTYENADDYMPSPENQTENTFFSPSCSISMKKLFQSAKRRATSNSTYNKDMYGMYSNSNLISPENVVRSMSSTYWRKKLSSSSSNSLNLNRRSEYF